MALYEYVCRQHGPFERPVADNALPCPYHGCGERAKRRYPISVNRSSLKQQGRWDPQVGTYVRNDREFRDLVKMGAEAESARLNMAVRHELVDSRDTTALCELHGTSHEKREADLEPTRKAQRAKAAT